MNLAIRFTQFERLPLAPSDAAALLASSCGCGDSIPEGAGTFAIAEPDAPASAATWSGTLVMEGELTGDGRYIEPNALRWENLPLPIRYAPVDTGGHQGAQVVGRILTMERGANGKINATGDFDLGSPIGVEAARVVSENITNGVSVDLDSVSFEVRIAAELMAEINSAIEGDGELEAVEPETDDEGRVTVMEMGADDEVMATTDARIRAATIVAIPAFIGASIQMTSEMPSEEAIAASAASLTLVAGAAQIPLDPPAAWFQDPALNGPTPITITEDGRIFGHLAVWGTCHTAYSGQCVEPPHSPSNYTYFRTGAILTAEGSEVSVGRITLDTMHAGRNLGPVDTMAHYEHTGRGAADVAAGEDVYGIWIAGALRPGLTDEKIRALRSSPLSGDWRRIGSGLELVAALAVNSPGFPVPRPQGLVASGGVMVSLVASGMLAPSETPLSGLSEDDLRYLRGLAARERTEITDGAEELAARVRSVNAAALARRVAQVR